MFPRVLRGVIQIAMRLVKGWCLGFTQQNRKIAMQKPGALYKYSCFCHTNEKYLHEPKLLRWNTK